jgi:primosomal replication protein N
MLELRRQITIGVWFKIPISIAGQGSQRDRWGSMFTGKGTEVDGWVGGKRFQR